MGVVGPRHVGSLSCTAAEVSERGPALGLIQRPNVQSHDERSPVRLLRPHELHNNNKILAGAQ
eukprot:4027568-Pyramimonas_sp.AAC.1